MFKNKIELDPYKPEDGTVSSSFRLQKNLVKMTDEFAHRYNINRVDVVTIALYKYLKDKFDNNYEPLNAFVQKNGDMIEDFENQNGLK